jgi:hypothetical protein
VNRFLVTTAVALLLGAAPAVAAEDSYKSTGQTGAASETGTSGGALDRSTAPPSSGPSTTEDDTSKAAQSSSSSGAAKEQSSAPEGSSAANKLKPPASVNATIGPETSKEIGTSKE